MAAAAAADERAADNPLLAQRPEKRILLVLVTGDNGLAGAFNSNLIKGAQRFSPSIAGAADRIDADRPQGPRLFPQAQRHDLGRAHRTWRPSSRYDDAAAIARKAMELLPRTTRSTRST